MMQFWKEAEFEVPIIYPEGPGHQAVRNIGVELRTGVSEDTNLGALDRKQRYGKQGSRDLTLVPRREEKKKTAKVSMGETTRNTDVAWKRKRT